MRLNYEFRIRNYELSYSCFLQTWIIFLLFLYSFSSFSQKKTPIYFIPGQGADKRLFDKIKFDTTRFERKDIVYELPESGEKLPEYAKRLSKQIMDSTFILVGTSLGGMIATEITELLKPKKTIVISSAKCRKELPFKVKFQKLIPIYKILPSSIIKIGALFFQPIFEYDSKDDETFKRMLKDKDPRFLKRTIYMISNWQRISYNEKIIHIHGKIDNTIRIINVKFDYEIKKGSHMMTLTRAKEISQILEEILKK